MKASTIDRDVILDRIARPKTRSVLFWWLFEHHDMVEEVAGGARMSWAELCASFAEQGMTDRNGNPPNPGTARQTWWRVRKEKKRLDERRAAALAERAARAAANPRRNMPSRFPKGNYPPACRRGDRRDASRRGEEEICLQTERPDQSHR